MSEVDTSRTAHYAVFAGRRRKFELRFGEIEELERLAGAGIGEIVVRLGTHRFRQADIRETIRLGLVGGGLNEAEATAIVMYSVDGVPFGETIRLAADIMNALIKGIPDTGKNAAEGASTDPATSPPSTSPEPGQA